MTVSRIAFDKELVLAGHFLLKHLQREDLHRLAAGARLTYHPRNAVIFQKGDPGSSMMAVVRGRVKICSHSLDGKELVLSIVNRGGVFGEIALLDGEPRTADAVALEETDLLVLDRTQFLPFLTARPEVAMRLLGVLCKRLRQTSEHLEDTLFLEASSRFARALGRLADGFGRPVPEGLQLDIKLSQQQLGCLVGVSRESVNKLLNEWQRNGVIRLDAGRITILDREALEDLGESCV
ncbi:Crp/Fnr family transcriptional regulator [Azospirillum agricola]|uniref:Crp/Fnr family transcriptional regulator n=1 Tax=Azospirillum agricola TaxID=1720247 RepID=UPI000A0F2C32|nr:Crp/Fnr family transcriptional regulator [Azospirillum agricola]SMH61967.1 cAMP-binding domain of CRP or a regulatory subunit of cAMP-dependent protein kinases [Azospirillum lipoferum]